MSFSTNKRIGAFLFLAGQSSVEENPLSTYKYLVRVYMEAMIHMKDAERKTHREKRAIIEKKMNNYNQYMQRYKKGMGFNPPREVFDLLELWEEELRTKLDKSGYLARRGESSESAME